MSANTNFKWDELSNSVIHCFNIVMLLPLPSLFLHCLLSIIYSDLRKSVVWTLIKVANLLLPQIWSFLDGGKKKITEKLSS